jgi:hypothetical protein
LIDCLRIHVFVFLKSLNDLIVTDENDDNKWSWYVKAGFKGALEVENIKGLFCNVNVVDSRIQAFDFNCSKRRIFND